jgi:hypothetical protein
MTAKLLTPKPALPLGELLCAAGLAQPSQVQAALERQRSSGDKLGDALIGSAALDPKDMAATLMVQQQVRKQLAQAQAQTHARGAHTHAMPACLRMGELLVARGDVARDVLDQALKKQQPGWRLGDVLLQMGAINEATLDRVLPLQKRLLSAVLCAGIGFAFTFASDTALAGTGATARLSISATIAKVVRVHVKGQPSSFSISPQDIVRGYVDIEQASVLEIRTNSAEGVALEFHGTDIAADIQAIQVTGGSSNFQMPASGGVMLMQGGWSPTLERTVQLRYRLVLGRGTQPGLYTWPLSVNVSAL